MQLPLGDGACVTLGPQLMLRKNVFQGLVLQLRDVSLAPELLARVRSLPRVRRFHRFPHALRVRRDAALHPSAIVPRPEDASEAGKRSKLYRSSDDPGLDEDWEDDDERGVGDRLLHLLQRWQVENVLLLVARRDDSLSGRLIGHELFKLVLEAAKLALEQYYAANVKPTDAARLELFEATNGARVIETPRIEDTSASASTSVPRPRASVCLLSTETVPSWPANHEPTSDGAGRKVTKRGRINHFLHGRSVSTSAPKEAASSPSLSAAVAQSSPEQQREPSENESNQEDVVEDALDWLGVTREEWLRLRAVRMPIRELHYLLMCLVVLVDKPLEMRPTPAFTPQSEESFTPPSYSWTRCRDVLQRIGSWKDKLRVLRGASLTRSQATALRAILQDPTLDEEAFRRVGTASVKLFRWVQRLLDEYDEHQLGIPPDDPAPLPQAHPTPVPPVQQPPGKSRPSVALSSPSRRSTQDAESALARELNALLTAGATSSQQLKIVDRGRLMQK
ncbi:hypothetical protein ATCC90586_004372 [Pythium insidiosum]|nr:hypothetical protein ATCC90586_004372 [Pythium insidiosum]